MTCPFVESSWIFCCLRTIFNEFECSKHDYIESQRNPLPRGPNGEIFNPTFGVRPKCPIYLNYFPIFACILNAFKFYPKSTICLTRTKKENFTARPVPKKRTSKSCIESSGAQRHRHGDCHDCLPKTGLEPTGHPAFRIVDHTAELLWSKMLVRGQTWTWTGKPHPPFVQLGQYSRASWWPRRRLASGSSVGIAGRETLIR